MPDAPLLIVAVIPFLVLAGLTIALLAGGRAGLRRVEGWRRLFTDLGIEVTQVIPDVQARIEGRVDGLAAALSDTPERETATPEPGPELVVSGLAGVDLAPAGRRRRQDVAVGDEPFDREVVVVGDAAVAAALLDEGARAAARRLVGLGVRVEAGRLTRSLGAAAGDAGRLRAAIAETLDLARRLRPPADLAGRLAELAGRDSVAGVRRQCVGLLAARYAAAPATGPALLAALDDGDALVRVRAASSLGEAGRAELRRLAGSRDDAIAVEAIGALGAEWPADEATVLLDGALEMGRAAVIEALVAALGRIGGERAQERLVGLLAAAGPSSVAAAEALATIGTAAAVPALHAAVAAHPLNLALRRAASAAIAAIQERATGAAPGQLAIADGEAGALALSEDDAAGRVALDGAAGDRDPAGPE